MSIPTLTRHYTQDELWNLFETLSPELKNAIFSSENAEKILAICERYDVENASKVSYLTSLVLFGLMQPQKLAETLAAELSIKKETAEAMFREIERFVLYPVRPALEHLHSQPSTEQSNKEKPALNNQTEPAKEQAKKPAKTKSSTGDKYLESIE